MKERRLARSSGFFLILAVGIAYYLFDCLLHFQEHPDLPWYETGVYTGPHGFPVTVAILVAAFVWLFRKGK